MIIAVGNQKGGVGKSLIATNLATMFSNDGKEVMLVDSDPMQHTSLNWLADRPENLLPIHGAYLPASNLLREAETLRKKYQIVIVDAGARLGEHVSAAVQISDMLVIPCRPSKSDLDSTALFIDHVKESMSLRPGLRGGILLNQVQENTTIAAVTRKQLETWDFPIFDNVLGHRVSFAEAMWNGQGVTEYAPKSAAAGDMFAFYHELQGVME